MYRYVYSSRDVTLRVAKNIPKFDIVTVRGFATDAVVKSSGGVFSGLFQRITSFLIGAGLTAVGTQYYLYEEIKKSNAGMISKQNEIEKRLDMLERKK